MKKLIKPLTYLVSTFLLLIFVLYLINLIPTKLDPRVEEIQNRPGLDLQSKDHPLSDLIQFIQARDHTNKSPDVMKEYEKLLGQSTYPADLRFPNTIKIAYFSKWNLSYLEYLNTRSEAEKYQGFSNALKFIESGLRTPDTLMQSLILVSSLKATALQLATQKLTEVHREALQSRISQLLDERVSLLQKALEKELELQVYFIVNAKNGSPPLDGASLWEKTLSPFLRPFFVVNATLNESYRHFESFQLESECLKDWTCKRSAEDDEFQLWNNPRNPIGKMILKMAQPGIQSRLFNLQKNWREIQNAIKE